MRKRIDHLLMSLLFWIRKKVYHWYFVVGDVDVECPVCGAETTIDDIRMCEVDGHFMCEDCAVHCDDVVLCKNHAPTVEDLIKYGVERKD